MSTRAQRLDPVVRDRLVCPQDLGELIDAGDELYNPRLRVAYSIDELGIPDMLIDDARTVSDEEHQAFTAVQGSENADD
ncbi:Trm112 family protein [Gordonia sp. HY002]|uniref:Trm112 family protein n=1 Tax=Gordonia zhenghanii TaxID=2911516 RepID=UPI001EF024EF|nr:Trm112 family protein [Gordonia zhenghanii]MCF8570651.1 Trm112 family protein [Gordonia zhenghanii]MCF8608138.1 Trm112 family protein [Gordonia zhenghanii]